MSLPLKAPPSGTATAASPNILPKNHRLNAVKTTLTDTAQGLQIAAGGHDAVLSNLGNHSVQLALCVTRHPREDRAGRSSLAPGAYSGSLTIEAAEGSIAATVPITVDVRFQHIVWLAFLMGPLILIGGSASVYASGRGASTEDKEYPLLSKSGVKKLALWFLDTPIPVGLGIGAAVLAFIANTASNPTFGSNPQKAYIALLGVTFAAFTTALAAASANYGKHEPNDF